MKILSLENISKKRLILQFMSIFILPYLFILLAGLLSKVWNAVYFHTLTIIIIAILIALLQFWLFIKLYKKYKKDNTFE